MNQRHIEALLEGIVPEIKQAIQAAQHPLLERIAALESREAVKGSPGENGKDGADGKDGLPGRDGKDGSDGRDGVDGKDAAPITREQIVEAIIPDKDGSASPLKSVIAEYLTQFPPPHGRDGRDGNAGRDGKDGDPGKDGKDGAPGLNGKDGLGFEDMSVEHDGERGFTLKFIRGDQTKEFPFTLPVVLDRGVWKEGAFKKGDAVTWGGSLFIAQKDTSTKPEVAGTDWRLAVKRGRDGKDGKHGDRGLQGQEGKPGRDGKGW